MITTGFYKGETVLLSIEIRSKTTNVLIDPTSVLITIVKTKMKTTDTEVIKINEISMSKAEIGKYYYDYTSDEVGIYSVIYKAIKDSKVTILKDSFTVI
mgnify:CR=1 FL=1